MIKYNYLKNYFKNKILKIMKSNSKIFKGLKLSIIDSIHLIYINYSRFSTQLDFISNKINKMPLFNNLQENQEILFEKNDDPNVLSIDARDLSIESPMTSFNDNDKFNNSLFDDKYGDLLNKLSNNLNDEINSVYLTY